MAGHGSRLPTIPMKTPKPARSLARLIGAFVLSAAAAHASVVFYDGFNYSTSFNGSTASPTWTVDGSFLSVTSPGLTYTGLSTVGNAVTSPNQFGRYLNHTLSSSQAQGVYWLGFLVKLQNDTTHGVGLSLFNGGTELSFWGSVNSSGAKWGNAAGGTYAGGAVTGDTTFIVLKLDSTVGKQWMWINPVAGGAVPELSAALNGVAGTAFTTGSFDRIRLGVFGNGIGTFDEVRLATTAADLGFTAVPEPSAFAALGGLAALGFAATRRRRS